MQQHATCRVTAVAVSWYSRIIVEAAVSVKTIHTIQAAIILARTRVPILPLSSPHLSIQLAVLQA